MEPEQKDIENSELIREYLLNYKIQRTVKGLKVPTPLTNHYHKQVKKARFILDIPNWQKIVNCPPSHKIILVEKDFNIQDIELPPKAEKHEYSLTEQLITLDYNNFSTQELFSVYIHPVHSIPFPNSFQTVGHMAHYNLTPEQHKYKKVIGEITLLKCPNITCVVHKSEKLHNVYRTPTLQMMAGIQDYTIKLKEQGTLFEFDFEKVYWCSRLQQERDRLLKGMKKGQFLADIFCGVGPLAVRAAKKGLYVLANDLNPEGFFYLQRNCKLNKVEDRVMCLNMCARQAMRKLFKQHESFQKEFRYPDHIYMNLPVDAIEFLDVLSDYGACLDTEKMPLVHVNCFVVADSDEKSKVLLAERISKVLPGFEADEIATMNHIKNVTIIMRMYCLTFRLRKKYEQVGNPEGQKLAQKQKQFEPNGEPAKKIKTE